MAKAPATVNAQTGSRIAPVVALMKIVYGNQKVAVPGSVFSPSSQAELEDLLAMGAVEAPSEAAQALFEKQAALDTSDAEPIEALG